MQALAERVDSSLTGVPPIPAMTTDAERESYYRLAKEAAHDGVIIELGAWMGASTAYIAAGVRDSGERDTFVHVFDKFESKSGHVRKVQEFYEKHGITDRIPTGPCLKTFKENLGPLMEFVKPWPGQIEAEIGDWPDDSVSLLVNDAAKRVPAISAVLTALRKALQVGSLMAWQDFCHFPSYEIPACLYRLRNHLEFVEAVVPGTTLVFRLKSQWSADEVSLSSLALSKWTPAEIEQAWAYWLDFVAPEKAALFRCGAAMFLCDIGYPDEAVGLLAGIYVNDADAIVKKWRYLRDARPDFVTRYSPLFAYLGRNGAL